MDGERAKEPINILINYVPGSDPNEDVMTVIKLNGSQMEFKSFGGFTANDIYNLLFEKDIKRGENNENGNN